MSFWTLHHKSLFKPTMQSYKPLYKITNHCQYANKPTSDQKFKSDGNVKEEKKCNVLHHKNGYSNPQYNPTTLTANKPTSY